MENADLKAVVKEAVKETLLTLGLTVDDPIEVQKDFQHIRQLRQGCEATKRNILKAVITTTIPAGLFIFWQVFKETIKR